MTGVARQAAWWLAAFAMCTASLPARADAGERPRASIEVDTSNVGEAGPIIQRRVEERGDVVLRDAEVLPGSTDDGDALIRIDVREMTGDDPGFAFDLWVERKGRAIGERRRVECNLCTETEIVAKAEQEIGAVVDSLIAEGELSGDGAGGDGGEVGPEPPSEPDSVADGQPASSGEDDDGSVLGAKGKAGVGLIVAGLLTTGTGIGLAIPDWKPVEDEPTRERSTRPVGIGLASAGGAVLVVGAVLLGLDRRQHAGRRPHAVVRPSRRGGTIGIAGRF